VPELRIYQESCLTRVREAFTAHRSVLLCSPCGSGKTVMFSAVCRGAAKRGNAVLILCHRVELIEQISAALHEEGVDHGVIAGNYPYIAGHRVYIASVFTLARRLDCFSPQLIIIDEAHHCSTTTVWGRILAAYPRAYRLGVTATPWRLSGEGLGEFFDCLIEGPTYEELQALGYLTALKVYVPPTISTEGLHTRFGDFIERELVERVARPQITGDAIEHYRRHTRGKRAIVFDVSVAAARNRAQEFRSAGFTADCIDGSLDAGLRRALVRDFRAGRLTVLTSCDLVSEGFDLPAIEVAIALRPTKSLGLFLQQTGRILRPFPGKSVATLFDHAGNVHRFGLPTEVRTWSLAGEPARADGPQRADSVRVCKTCFCANPARTVVCRACGTRFETQSRQVVQADGDLEEYRGPTAQELARRRIRQEQERAQTFEALQAYARLRGYKPGWAEKVWAARQRKALAKRTARS
jgi:DNA repair protein RadD